MDYSFFDGLIDSVFVINSDRRVMYCNESAARLCDSSVRRLAKRAPIYDVIQFSDKNLFTMPGGDFGETEGSPYVEIEYRLMQSGSTKGGKVQVAIQPFSEPSGEKRWVVMIHDVTLEEVLHSKYHKQLEEKEKYIKQLQDAQKQLEQYSKNLEQMVEERTQEVNRANLMLSAIMNSLGQGFFVFDKEGVCSNFYTRACEDILEVAPPQRRVWEVLKVPANEFETFQLWLKAIYGEQLPFDSIKELGPSQFKHSCEKYVTLEYYPLRGDNKKISNVVVVATDKTREYLANKALEKEKKFAKMVIKLVTSKKQFSQFLQNAEIASNNIRKNMSLTKDVLDHEYIFRVLHTLEGEAAAFSASEIWSSAREAQEIIEPLRRGEKIDGTQLKADILKSLVELDVIYKNFMKVNSELFSTVGIGSSDKIEIFVSDVEEILKNLEKKGIGQSVRCYVEDALLRESVGPSFRHYQDIVDMVATKLEKRVRPLEFHGLDVRVHIERYQELFSTLIHAYKNAVDHGIESSEERERLGKSPEGLIRTYIETFMHNGSWLRIKIADDGRGISSNLLRKKLASTSQTGDIRNLNDFDIMQLVFNSGLSTKDEVGEFSGRGIGMNAIRDEAERLGGRAWVESVENKGTQIIVEVPDLPRVERVSSAA